MRVRYKPPFAIDAGATGERAREEAEVASEIETSIRAADFAASFAAASPGYRRAVLAAQFAEVLRDSVHARDDSYADLLTQTENLARSLDGPDAVEVAELHDLMKRAEPLVRARTERSDRELERLADALRRLHYDQGRREQLAGEEGVDPEVERATVEEIERLEERIRHYVAEHFGVPAEPTPEAELTPETLRKLGYSDDRR